MSEEIMLTVRGAFYAGDAITVRTLCVPKNENMLTALKKSGLYLKDCGGNGVCGKCRARFWHHAPAPTESEKELFSAEQLEAGIRLLCRHRAQESCEIALEGEPARIPDAVESAGAPAEAEVCGRAAGEAEAASRSKADGRDAKAAAHAGETAYFAAVDIGTTTVVMKGICGEEEIGMYSALNPQRAYGADVISRIGAGMQGHAEDMRRQMLKCLEEGVCALLAQSGRRPQYMVIAANTTMIHLLCGHSVEPLSAYPFEPVNIRPQQIVVAGIPAYIICGFSAFIGGDILSGMAANNLHNASDLQIFIDLGTNGEMVLGKKGRFLCASTAAGPAFEGNVSADLMGADLVRIAAKLLEEKIMDEHGLLRDPYFEQGIDRAGAHIRQQDIRELQKAKAAIAAGIDILLKEYGALKSEVERVILAGGFGYYVSPEAAMRIGLLPMEFAGKITAVGNAALAGACLLGKRLGKGGMREWEEQTGHLADDLRGINLASCGDFSEDYIAHLDFPA